MNNGDLGSIAIIGAGNMAFRLGIALAEAGIDIKAVYNRNRENGEKLVRALNRNCLSTQFYDSLDAVPEVDLMIIAVSDDAIQGVAEAIGKSVHAGKCTVVHTSGATDSQVLLSSGCPYGVLYPLMTLSKSKNVNFNIVPFLLEGSDEKVRDMEVKIVTKLGSEYKFMGSQDRLRMHAAAVFSCNFVSYMLSLAHELVKDNPVFLMPLTIETVRKYFMMLDPKLTITGPARRGDLKTLGQHEQLLEQLGMEKHLEVYRYISEKIMEDFCENGEALEKIRTKKRNTNSIIQ